jgi:hypothetical protein
MPRQKPSLKPTANRLTCHELKNPGFDLKLGLITDRVNSESKLNSFHHKLFKVYKCGKMEN